MAKTAPAERLKVTPSGVRPVDRLRWSMTLTSELVDLSENKILELVRRGDFPPRVAVDGKEQFVPDEVRAWAAGGDWRSMVRTRLEVRSAS